MVHHNRLCHVLRVDRRGKRKRGDIVSAKQEVRINEERRSARNGELGHANNTVCDKLAVLGVEHVREHVNGKRSIGVSVNKQHGGIGERRQPGVAALGTVISGVIAQVGIHHTNGLYQLSCGIRIRNRVNLHIIKARKVLVMLKQIKHKQELVILVGVHRLRKARVKQCRQVLGTIERARKHLLHGKRNLILITAIHGVVLDVNIRLTPLKPIDIHCILVIGLGTEKVNLHLLNLRAVLNRGTLKLRKRVRKGLLPHKRGGNSVQQNVIENIPVGRIVIERGNSIVDGCLRNSGNAGLVIGRCIVANRVENLSVSGMQNAILNLSHV